MVLTKRTACIMMKHIGKLALAADWLGKGKSMNQFFTDKQGKPMLLLGLQAMNSSTGSPLMAQAIQAVQRYGGNVLEAPIYWHAIEPEMDRYDLSLVQGLIDQARQANLHLILLWFGTSKNGHPNYAPEYVKLDPQTYQITVGPNGAQHASLSPHCMATLERDRKAFCEVMTFLQQVDGDIGTVLAVQIENEMGYANTDRDYSTLACADYEKPLPEALRGVALEDCGACDGSATWRGQFGRHAHEAFSAWYHARYIGAIARAGKAIYALPMITNVMVGELNIQEAGVCYNAGAAVGRVLDIWKAGAPELDLLCPDIYTPVRSEYTRIAARYAREDNALFIPESAIGGEANAINAMLAFADYGCIGLCCFGAERALRPDGTLKDECRTMMMTMRAINGLAPLLIRYRGTGRVHALVQEEFATEQYLKLEHFHVVAHFFRGGGQRVQSTQFDVSAPEYAYHASERGRALLVEVSEYEYFLAGAGVAVDFLRRPEPQDDNPFPALGSRQSTQLNFLSVEEGHFDADDQWHVDFLRNGDQSNFQLFVHGGEAVRIRLNPGMAVKVV